MNINDEIKVSIYPLEQGGGIKVYFAGK